ncbi:MAG: ABC transporter ATP-binding protein [Eubacteriales bacterium]|nr:ABC transporter ATP-binding protein [Eubacteriales bacterium]
MLKSVWLSNIITASMNDAGSLLSSYYLHLRELTGAGDCMMMLSEPDDGRMTCFLISPRATCLTPVPALKTDDRLIEKVMKSRTSEYDGGMLYCPLCFENAASFGALVFASAAKNIDKNPLADALTAFSLILYSESMGSIVRSVHDTVMSVENLCVDYQHGKMIERVVKNVNLEIYEKEFTVIVGASGSGKSSLLNVLGGMLTAAEGTVRWKDTDVTAMTERERTAYRGGTVGFIFQRYNLISDLTAEENINIASSLVKNPLSAEEVLDMVGLKHKAKSYPSQLSGGEQQRVCIARALVKRAKLLLCDEPTGALDTENTMQVIRILKGIAKEQGIPVVVITHNTNLVVLADHCITIRNGMVVEDRMQPFALSAEDLKLQ